MLPYLDACIFFPFYTLILFIYLLIFYHIDINSCADNLEHTHAIHPHPPTLPCNSIIGQSIDRPACSLKESFLIKTRILSLAPQAPLST